MNKSHRNKIGRISLILASIFLIILSVTNMMTGGLGWRNYWGGLLSPPFVILISLLLLYAAIFRWDKMQKKQGDKKGRIPDAFKDDWKKW